MVFAPHRVRFILPAVLVVLVACAIAPASASAAYNITVSNAATTNIDYDGRDYTPLGLGANINAAELSGRLQTDFVNIDTELAGPQPGTVTFSAPVTAPTGMSSLHVTSGSTVTIAAPITLGGEFAVNDLRTVALGASVVANSRIEFSGPIGLTATATLTSQRFAFAAIDGAHALTVVRAAAGGTPFAEFTGAIGASTPLAALTVTLPEVDLSGNVTTTGTQRYNALVRLTQTDKVFTATTGAVEFNGVVRDQAVTINAAAGASFFADSFLPSLVVNGGTATIATATIVTFGAQTWNAPVRLENDVELEAGSGAITLANAVDGAHALTLKRANGVNLGGVVGATAPLTSLVAQTAVTITSSRITTTGPQYYELATTVQSPTNLVSTSGSVTFARELISTSSVDIDAGTFARIEYSATAATLDTQGSAQTQLAGRNVTVTSALHLGTTQVQEDRMQLEMTGAATMTAHGAVDLGANLLELEGAATFAGSLTGTAGISYDGSGGKTLTFAGSTSPFSGLVYVGSGNITLATLTGLPNAQVRLPNGVGSVLTVQSASSVLGSVTGSDGTIALGPNALTVGGDNTSTNFGGTITGSGRLTKAGSGIWTLNGTSTFTGTVGVTGGVLELAVPNALASASAADIVSPGTLRARQLTLGQLTGTGTITGAPLLLTIDNAAPTTFGGTIAGATQLVATGTAPLTLAGMSASTGSVTVESGSTLALASAAALPLAPNATVNGTLDIRGFTFTPAQLLGTGTVTDSSLAAPGTVVLTNAAATTVVTSLTGNLGVTQTGAGPITLGTTNTYSAATNVDAGSLIAGVTGALPTTTALRVATGARGDLSLVDHSIASLGGSGTVATGTAARTLTLTTPGALAWSGVLEGAATVALTGAGTHTLAGASPAFAGRIAVDAGALEVAGSIPSATVTLTDAELRGTGTVGAVMGIDASSIAPGLASAATLRTGSLDLDPGVTTRLDVVDRTNSDRVDVAGTVQLGGSTLQLGSVTMLARGTSVVLVDNDGRDAVAGTFAGLPERASVIVDGVVHTISYVGGTGNDVTLSRAPLPVVPDPVIPAPVTPAPAPVSPTPAVPTPAAPSPDGATPAPARPLSVLLGLDRYVAYAGRSLVIRLASTRSGAMRVQVLRGRKVVANRYLKVAAGRSTKSVARMPTVPGTYTVRVTITADDGTTDTDTARLVVRKVPVARR